MKYDLAIVGAGVLGTFSAYNALKKGLKVVLLEKDNFAEGSSVQNFGQIVPSGFDHKWCNIGIRSLEIYKEIQAKADISFKQTGSLYIASDDEECQLIHELNDKKDTLGYDSLLYTKKQIISDFPTIKNTYCKEGLFFKDDAQVNPRVMIHRLQQYMVEQMGLRLETNATVISCEDTSTKVTVRTSNNIIIEAENVWIFSGYVFNLLYPEVFKNSGLIVSQLQMLKTIPLSHLKLGSNILTGLTIRRYEAFESCPSFKNLTTPKHYSELQRFGIHILFKQEADGSIIVGDSHEYASCNKLRELGLGSKEVIDELIISEAQRIIEMPKNTIAYRWTGRYSQHKNEIFEYEISDRIHICTGIGGKGMTSGARYTEMKVNNRY